MSGPDIRLQTEDLVRQRLSARRLSLTARTPVSSVIAGVHSSRFRGRGVDFLESRNYEVGDDIRDLDWRVTARTGRPHTKVFQEERERPVLAVVDISASMYFATRGALKVIQASRLAALIGWAAVRRGDRIGALLFDDNDHHEVRPAGGRRGVMRLISQLTRTVNSRGRPPVHPVGPLLDEALQRTRRIARPGSLIFLLSDFYTLGPDSERHLTYLRRHSDLVACRILDDVERTIPPAGTYPISDGRNQGVLDLRRARARTQYREFLNAHETRFVDLCTRLGIARLVMNTTDDPSDVLGRLFRVRAVA